jgi:type IV pilus assembly protein PilV
MVVLAVGLLGLAGLQATSLKNNQSAYNRSQATQLASDMADRLRANRNYAKLADNNYTSVAADDAVAKTNCLSAELSCPTALVTQEGGGQTCPGTQVSGCTAGDMAQNDLYEWNKAITASLPGGKAEKIKRSGDVFTITLSWTENRYAKPGEGEASVVKAGTGSTEFKMSFQP